MDEIGHLYFFRRAISRSQFLWRMIFAINFDLLWRLIAKSSSMIHSEIVKITTVETECSKITYMFFSCVLKDVDGGWSSWGHWSECSATCGDLSVRKRNRLCNNPIPQNGGKACEGQIFELELCNVTSCPQGTCLDVRFHIT